MRCGKIHWIQNYLLVQFRFSNFLIFEYIIFDTSCIAMELLFPLIRSIQLALKTKCTSKRRLQINVDFLIPAYTQKTHSRVYVIQYPMINSMFYEMDRVY